MGEKLFRLCLFIGVPIAIAMWILFLFVAAGYQYELGKFKALVFTLTIVLIIQFMILDPIKFVVQTLWDTFVWKQSEKDLFRYGIPRAKQQQDEIRFFKLRIEWGKTRLSYNWRHKDEGLNLFYQKVARDLLFYGRFFISLIILIIILNEPMQFYHSEGLRKTFGVGYSGGADLENIGGIDKLYDYIEASIIDTFDSEQSKRENIKDFNWVPDEMSKLLGITRLQQVRYTNRLVGLGSDTYQNKKFFPGWQPYQDYPYRSKFWRTYDPWIPVKVPGIKQYENDGYFGNYPNDRSYVALLTRHSNNSRNILKFLKKQEWLDRHTSVLFIDFAVYNVDTNLFALCRITAETTPFGSTIVYLNFQSMRLLLNWEHTSNWYWLALLVYVIQLMVFIKNFVTKAWYGSFSLIFRFWRILDAIIIISSILVFIFIYLRENETIRLVNELEIMSKEKYISFETAKIYGRCAEIFLAFLVCCATVRLWKTLLFARVFRLYVRTLQLGAYDIFWALVNIMIFLAGLTVSSYMINSTARTESHAPITCIHILSFSLGYSERVNPLEKSPLRTTAISLIVYALMMFGVTLVLLNMLITLICIHYAQAKEEERSRPKPKIHFWQFLMVEYGYVFQIFKKIQQMLEKRLGEANVDKLKQNIRAVEAKLGVKPKKIYHGDLSERAEIEASHLRRIRIATDILLTQTEILKRRMNDLNISFDTNGERN